MMVFKRCGLRGDLGAIWGLNSEDRSVRRTIATLLGIAAVACAMPARAEVTVMAVRLGENDVVALAMFYLAAFGLK